MQNNNRILCADDFAYTEGISDATLELCQSGVINATSVMIESPLIEHYAPLLAKYERHVQIGLHFNLTELFSKKTFSLPALMFSLRLSATKRKQIAERLNQQLDQFETHFGKPPDFIDGHQHVHIMPGVRKIFLRIIDQRYRTTAVKPWIRQVSSSLKQTDTPFKVAILNLFNLGFRTQCRKYNFSCNEMFAGVYSLAPTTAYKTLLYAWLHRSPKNTLIMCHPSMEIPMHTQDTDTIVKARLQEYNVLRHLLRTRRLPENRNRSEGQPPGTSST